MLVSTLASFLTSQVRSCSRLPCFYLKHNVTCFDNNTLYFGCLRGFTSDMKGTISILMFVVAWLT